MTEEKPELTAEPVGQSQAQDVGSAPAATEAPSPEPIEAPAEQPPVVGIPAVQDVHDLDWAAVDEAVTRSRDRSRLRATVERFEALLDQEGG
ncbi:MAG TPA: hypothetical protein VM913_01110, partial [Sphingomicrobium sp.]|nr:hypothetical protein [Sphingomicrobium sp.]